MTSVWWSDWPIPVPFCLHEISSAVWTGLPFPGSWVRSSFFCREAYECILDLFCFVLLHLIGLGCVQYTQSLFWYYRVGFSWCICRETFFLSFDIYIATVMLIYSFALYLGNSAYLLCFGFALLWYLICFVWLSLIDFSHDYSWYWLLSFVVRLIILIH